MGMWIRTFYFDKYLPRYVGKSIPQTILDAGCGSGSFSVRISQLYPSAQITSIDLRQFPAWTERNLPNITFKVGDLAKLKENSTYELVISVDVLEHIPQNEEVIHRIYQALQPGGIFYLAVPCDKNETLLFPRPWFSRFHEWEEHEHIGEMRDLNELVKVMKKAGFEILLSRYTFTFWGARAWEFETLLHWKGKWGNRLNVILMPLYKLLGLLDFYIPIGKGNNLIVARRPK